MDQYLVLEDATATRVPPPPAADVAGLLTPIKARYASDQEYRAALGQAQISEAELSGQLLAGLRMLRYTDLRFRPEVWQLSEETLRAYYDKLAQKGAPAQTFEASRGDIESCPCRSTDHASPRPLAGDGAPRDCDRISRGSFQVTRARHLTGQILVATVILVVICAVRRVVGWCAAFGWFRELVRGTDRREKSKSPPANASRSELFSVQMGDPDGENFAAGTAWYRARVRNPAAARRIRQCGPARDFDAGTQSRSRLGER